MSKKVLLKADGTLAPYRIVDKKTNKVIETTEILEEYPGIKDGLVMIGTGYYKTVGSIKNGKTEFYPWFTAWTWEISKKSAK